VTVEIGNTRGDRHFERKGDQMSGDKRPHNEDDEEEEGLYSGGEDEKGNTGAPDMGQDEPPEPFEVPDDAGSDG
jgi:hypothetical protein